MPAITLGPQSQEIDEQERHLGAELVAAIKQSDQVAIVGWLEKLVNTMNARGAGLWLLHGYVLRCMGQVFGSDVREDVVREFNDATAMVKLSRLGLGIVNAAIDKTTVVATKNSGPIGSRDWLGQIGGDFSCSVPLVGARRILGVLAVASTAHDPSDIGFTRTQFDRLGRAISMGLHPARPTDAIPVSQVFATRLA